jgi:hypothetical protein
VGDPLPGRGLYQFAQHDHEASGADSQRAYGSSQASAKTHSQMGYPAVPLSNTAAARPINPDIAMIVSLFMHPYPR